MLGGVMAARRAGLSPLDCECEAPLSCRPVCFLQRHTPAPIGLLALPGGFSRIPADGSFPQFLIFEIQDLSPLANVSRPLRGDLRSKKSTIFLWAVSFDFDSAAQAKNFSGLSRRPGQGSKRPAEGPFVPGEATSHTGLNA